MRKMSQKQQGFTLLELVVVVALLGLVTSLAAEYMVDKTSQARIDDTDQRRQTVRSALEAYFRANGDFPATLDLLVDSSNPFILDVSFETCDDSGSPKQVAVYRDGWGNGYNADPSTACSDSTFKDFGWAYTYDAAAPKLYSNGLDGATQYPTGDYPVTTGTFATASAAELVMVTSGATATVSCMQGSSSVPISNCIP